MSKTRWEVWTDDGYPVVWAPYFDTQAEANDWIAEVAEDDGWDGRVEALEFDVKEEA